MESSKIASLGWFSRDNCGDESFKLALQTLFPDRDFSFFSDLAPNLNEINEHSHLLIGGGNIVSKDFLRWLKAVSIPFTYIGIGLISSSPLELLEGASQIFVRDFRSLALAGLRHPNALIIPDLTFSLTPDLENGKKLLNSIPSVSSTKKTLGIFLNDNVSANFNSSILRFIEAEKVKLELARFLEALPYNLVFIPMAFRPPDDRRISLDVLGKMLYGYKHACITEIMSPQDCLDLTATLDLAITMRLHASIFCTLGSVPFIDLTHHDKSKTYLQSIEHSDYSVDYYGLNAANLSSTFSKLEANSTNIKAHFCDITNHNKEFLRETTTNVHLLPR